MKNTTATYEWLTPKEAAKYIHCHADTIREACRRGELRAVKVGRTWRTTKQWADEYLLGGAA